MIYPRLSARSAAKILFKTLRTNIHSASLFRFSFNFRSADCDFRDFDRRSSHSDRNHLTVFAARPTAVRKRQIVADHDTKMAGSFAGPLPPPTLLASYDQVAPGLADRIVTMAERQAAHRQTLESKLVEGSIFASKAGMACGLIVALAVLVTAGWIATHGGAWPGALLGVGDLTALVTVFVARERSKKSTPDARKMDISTSMWKTVKFEARSAKSETTGQIRNQQAWSPVYSLLNYLHAGLACLNLFRISNFGFRASFISPRNEGLVRGNGFQDLIDHRVRGDPLALRSEVFNPWLDLFQPQTRCTAVGDFIPMQSIATREELLQPKLLFCGQGCAHTSSP